MLFQLGLNFRYLICADNTFIMKTEIYERNIKMKKNLTIGLIAVVVLGLSANTFARTHVSIGVGIGGYYQPAPVVVAPPPVVVVPQPVVVAPPPVVYYPTYYRPAYYYPSYPSYCYPSFGFHYSSGGHYYHHHR
jgi:hypothetical protein